MQRYIRGGSSYILHPISGAQTDRDEGRECVFGFKKKKRNSLNFYTEVVKWVVYADQMSKWQIKTIYTVYIHMCVNVPLGSIIIVSVLNGLTGCGSEYKWILSISSKTTKLIYLHLKMPGVFHFERDNVSLLVFVTDTKPCEDTCV